MTAVNISKNGEIFTFQLDRPQSGNSLSPELVGKLHAALDLAEAEACRGVVFTGAGRHFCTGFDLSDLEHTWDNELLARFVQIELLLQRVWLAPFTTVAIAHGRTMGAGADLFAACTMRLATEGATFGFPGAAFGLVLGTRRLACRVGEAVAHQLIVNGQIFDVGAAIHSGLATARVGPEASEQSLDDRFLQLDRLDLVTLAAVREQMRHASGTLDGDLAALVRSASRPGLRERIMAYRRATLEARSQTRATA